MTKSIILHTTLLGLVAAVLAACSSKTTPTVSTTIQPSVALPSGERMPEGTVINPTGSTASYKAVDFLAMPQWQEQNFINSLESFHKGCSKLQNNANWRNVCLQAHHTPRNQIAAKSFFERYFTPWQVSENGNLGGTVTGYYEPILHGNSYPTSQARFPIYGIPNDFISVNLPAELRGSKSTVRIQHTGKNQGQITTNGSYTANLAAFPINERTRSIKGRFVGNQFVPYHTRSEINAGALNNKAPILGYADDPVELFFLQIQGSGRLKTPDGRYIRLGFADKNEFPYVSIGRYMADKGYLPLSQTTMQGIKAWIQKNPAYLAEVLGQNPSYVFFRQLDSNNDGPIGALGTPLMGEYAAAVDRRYISLGAPLFVATTHPETRMGLNRLLMAQDTGSAIRGAVRVDYFWGYGDDAGRVAGKMKHTGYVWQLLPNGMMPEYRP